VLNDAAIVYAIAEDQEQVDKLVEAMPRCRRCATVYYDDPRGLRHYEGVLSYDELTRRGASTIAPIPGSTTGEVAKGTPDDVSIMLYTSGNDGQAERRAQTHAAFIAAAKGGCEFDGLTAADSILSYLPMAWVGDHLFSYAQWL
jgi:long-chain acyl-CoA synthetase